MPSFALDVMARALVLMSIAWLVAAVARQQSASLRAGIWTLAFAGLLALPALARVTPAWRIPILPAAPISGVTLPPDVARPDDPAPAIEGRDAGQRRDRPPIGAVSASTQVRYTAPQAGGREDNLLRDQPAPETAGGRERGSRLGVQTLAVALWAVVAFMLLARVALNRIAAARLVRGAGLDCEVVDAHWRADIDATRAQLGITRRVAVRLTDSVAVPAIIGVWRPVLLLPSDAGRWASDARRVVVLHELAHVARWDGLDQLVAEICSALYWIVPPVWIAARSAASLREQATDDAVLRAGVKPSAYAANLIDLARNIVDVDVSAASLAMAASRIQDRVRAILDPTVGRGRVTLLGSLALILVAGLTVTTLAAVTPERRQVPPAPSLPIQAPVASTPAPAAPRATVAPPAVAALAPHAAIAPSAGVSRSSSGVMERSALCPDGRDSFSNSSNDDGSHQTWSVTISGRGCRVELKSEGKLEFNDAFTDVRSITPSGYFRLSLSRTEGRRDLDIEGRGTSLTHTYRVDGSTQPYDAAAQTWFAEFLIELDRETAVGIDVRLPTLLKQGGVDAVLNETPLMTSDYARNRYYAKLGELVTLTPADIVRILNQASSLGTQDYYAAELLKSLGSRLGDSSSERAALLALVGGMRTDYYIVEGVNAVFNTRRMSAGDIDVLLRLTPKIRSDYYMLEIVKRLTAAGRLDGAQRGQLSQVLPGMREDYYMAAVIAELMRDGSADAASRQAIIGAVSRIRSGYYASESVRALVRDPKLDEQDLLHLVDIVKPIREDHYKSQSLQIILRHANVTDKVRQAAIDASAGLSKYYRDEVLKAVRQP